MEKCSKLRRVQASVRRLSIVWALLLCGYAALQAQSMGEAKAISNYWGEGRAGNKDAAIKAAKTAFAAKIKPELMKDAQYRKADGGTCWKIADLAQVFISGTTAVVYIPKSELKRVYAEATMFDELPDDGLDEFGNLVADDNRQQKVVERPPVVESPPVAEAPQAKAEKAVEKPKPVVAEKTAQPVVEKPQQTVAASPAKTGNKILDEILDAHNLFELTELFNKSKNAGALVYGRLGTMTASENSYLLLYKQDGTIVAVYDKGTSTRKNLRTGTTENYASSFDNVKIIWFQLY
ncbi:hypothetical protein FACS189430_09550 [Bacteroidia bacterium]|nr:hypothetical protein FACS189430_09550 [Bacteroidia bacterium]